MTAGEILLWAILGLCALALLWATYNFFVTRQIARKAEELVPPPGRFVTIDGHKIHYLEEGEGRPILFVHGLGGTLFHFSFPLFDRLADSGYRLIAVDRPGSGYSTRTGDRPATPAEHAKFLLRFMKELGIGKPLVVGHSLGGAIALALALDHPDTISGLALISPLTHHNEEIPAAFRPLHIKSALRRRIFSSTVAVPASVKYREQTLAFVFGPQQPPQDYAIAGGAMSALRPAHIYGTSTDFVAIADTMKAMEARYGELDMPVGILFGSADNVIDSRMHGEQMRGKVRGLDLEILEGIGHMPQYVATDRVVAFIRRIADRAFSG